MARCFYCSENLFGGEEPEHILPAAISAELTTPLVHTACNRRAGVQVDQPWLSDPQIRQARERWVVPDRRGGLAPRLQERGKMPDGSEALVTVEGSRIEVRWVPQKIQDGETIRLTGYTPEDFERAAARLKAKGYALMHERGVREDALSATVSWELSVDVWPRFVAKVALGVASLLVTDEWLDTPGAQLLQSVLWSGHPDSRQYAVHHPGQAWSAVPFPLEEGTHPLMPPEHLLTFETDDRGRDWLSVIVFAEFLYSVPLDVDRGRMPA